jgi:hypothetical protein
VRLDLDRHRTLGELVGQTFELFGRHLATFLGLTLLVVAPIILVVDGGWGGALADGGDADPSLAAGSVSLALSVLVIPPLVTALHVAVVQAQRGDLHVGLRAPGGSCRVVDGDLRDAAVLRLARPQLAAVAGPAARGLGRT